METFADLSARFWVKVAKREPSACWPWIAHRDRRGYGRISIGGKLKRASRVALELSGVVIPPGHGALHHCDNPACVNPEHLFVGTQADNMRDCAAKRRLALQSRPELSRSAKLTADDARKIRAVRGIVSQSKLAQQYGLTTGAISHVMTRRTWK